MNGRAAKQVPPRRSGEYDLITSTTRRTAEPLNHTIDLLRAVLETALSARVCVSDCGMLGLQCDLPTVSGARGP